MDVKLPPKQLYVGSSPIERTSGYNSIYCCLTARATASFFMGRAVALKPSVLASSATGDENKKYSAPLHWLYKVCC